jgi:hypothetical protein
MEDMNWAAYLYTSVLLLLRQTLICASVLLSFLLNRVLLTLLLLVDPSSTFTMLMVIGFAVATLVAAYRLHVSLARALVFVVLTIARWLSASIRFLLGSSSGKSRQIDTSVETGAGLEQPDDVAVTVFANQDPVVMNEMFDPSVDKEKTIVPGPLQALRPPLSIHSDSRSMGVVVMVGALLPFLL